MQCHERRLAPSRERDQDVVAARKQDGNAQVDQAEGARPVADVLARLKLKRHEPDVGGEVAKGDGREHDVQNDVDTDEDAQGPAGQVAHPPGERFKPPGAQESREEDGGV